MSLPWKELPQPYPEIQAWGFIYGDRSYIISYDSSTDLWMASSRLGTHPTKWVENLHSRDEAEAAIRKFLQ